MKNRANNPQLQSEINKALGRINEVTETSTPAKKYSVWWSTDNLCGLMCNGKEIETHTPERMLKRIWEIEDKLNEN